MASLNKLQLIGHLGKDPEQRQTLGGKVYCTFSVATSEKWTDGSGQPQERTEWHSVTVFTKAADACLKHLAKGSLVYVEGRLESREYEKDGIKRRAYQVNAFSVMFLSFKEKAANGAPAGVRDDTVFPDGSDDDIPF